MRSIFSTILLFLCVLIIYHFLISFSSIISNDEKHQEDFNKRYAIFSIVKPEMLDFAGEQVPFRSNAIWERLDKELLKNIYWQSNTLLYFKRANKYFPIIEEILKKNNIPDDFKYLAVIESGLENVTSPSGAKGFWQILKGTAKEYNLEVNSFIDERYNLEKSTQAACEYLKEAKAKFGSWTMAAASYNMGMNGAQRAIDLQNTNNYYNLYLNSETSRYIFRIIAVKEIMKNPSKYGFLYRLEDLYIAEEYKVVKVDSTIDDLYKFCSQNMINYKLLKRFNPWILTSKLPDESRKIYHIKIPDASSMIFEDNLNSTER